jgi:hypothetical protein
LQNTNVIELYSRIIKHENQLTYYNSGIGTYARPSWRSFKYWKQVINNKIDLAIAWYHFYSHVGFYLTSQPLGTSRKAFLRAIVGSQIIISLAIGYFFSVWKIVAYIYPAR